MITRRMAVAIALALPVIGFACGDSGPTEPTGNDDDTPPPRLDLFLSTDDSADAIHVTSEPGNLGESLTLCLTVSTASGWWKGVGVNETQPTLEGVAADGDQCMTISPGLKTLAFWKAKGLGVHTQVGSRSLDLSEYAGHRIRLEWTLD